MIKQVETKSKASAVEASSLLTLHNIFKPHLESSLPSALNMQQLENSGKKQSANK